MSKRTEAIAILIANTHRKKRPTNLFDIYKVIKYLTKELGEMKKVAEIAKISLGMLRKFMAVNKIDPGLHKYIRERVIDSVSVIYSTSFFKAEDQKKIFEAVIAKKINSNDLKFLRSLRKQKPQKLIEGLIDNLLDSKNKKVKVIFHYVNEEKSENIFNQLSKIIGTENIYDMEIQNGILTLKVLESGEKILRELSKSKKKTLEKTINELVEV